MNTRVLGDGLLSVDAAGSFAFIPKAIGCGEVEPASKTSHRLRRSAEAYIDERRRAVPPMLDYLILVPTLRCNLACSYCQVSRAAQNAEGYDWDDATLTGVLDMVSQLQAPAVKIEFQGGEPTLRPDLIQAVIDAVPVHIGASFVICTNLQVLNDAIIDIFDRADVTISTSLDGPVDVHAKQRGNLVKTRGFVTNLEWILERYGPEKVSALPTIDANDPPEPQDLVSSFEVYGFTSIYLRPINYQGFARKQHAASREIGAAWSAYHKRFIEHLIDRNQGRDVVIEETYFSMLLDRIFRPGSQRHVDLRNPNPVGRDYVVIDYDGTAYPTDEARMLSRSGVIDLAIGDVRDGWDTPERSALDAASTNDGDPHCDVCVYKPYCGRDIVDDLSRYGTIDISRNDTEFCRRHMAMFDLAFELIHSREAKVRHSLGKWLRLPGPMPLMALPT